MKNSLEGGKLFFSVERFDYTKGILEKLEAYERYLEMYPDRIGKDVFYQLAPLNRQKIHTYSRYQVGTWIFWLKIYLKLECM